MQAQQMGALLEERLNFESKPFHSVCLDLLGPIVVKSMVNKRASMKVWPLLFVCQSTGAIYCTSMEHKPSYCNGPDSRPSKVTLQLPCLIMVPN